jgi:hypothetical protein
MGVVLLDLRGLPENPPHPALRATFSPMGRRIADGAILFVSIGRVGKAPSPDPRGFTSPPRER